MGNLLEKPGPLLSLEDPAAAVPSPRGEITTLAEAGVMVCMPRCAAADLPAVLLAKDGPLVAAGSCGACCLSGLRPKPKPVLAVEHHRAAHTDLPETVAGSDWLA